MNFQNDVTRSYIAKRRAYNFTLPASQCLELARIHAPPKFTTYDSILPARFGAAGAPFKVGASECRWIEKPESAFRFVGATSDIARREGWNHRAWDTLGYYVDSFQSDSTRPVVYQLTGHDGKPRYIAGGSDAFNADKDGRGPAYLELESYDDLRAACKAAEQIAETYAESAREYDEAYQAGGQARESIDEARQLRRDALELCAERRALRAIVPAEQFPAACGSIASDIREAWRKSRKALKRAAELREQYAGTYTGADNREAFNEAFGQ